jgi:hypothetical protein
MLGEMLGGDLPRVSWFLAILMSSVFLSFLSKDDTVREQKINLSDEIASVSGTEKAAKALGTPVYIYG